MKKILLPLLLAICTSVFSQNYELDSEPNLSSFGTYDWLLDGSSYKAGVYSCPYSFAHPRK